MNTLGTCPESLTGLEIRFFQQGFVLLGHHVVLHLGHEIHGYHHDDQQGRSTKVKGHVVFQNQELGQQAHKGDVNRTGERQAHQNFVDIARSLITGTYAGNKSAALFQVVSCFAAVEHQRGVKKAKEHNGASVKNHIDGLAWRKRCGNVFEPTHAVTGGEPAHHGSWQQNDGRSKKTCHTLCEYT